MTTLSVHVLDSVAGTPAAGLSVLLTPPGCGPDDPGPVELVTDDDGRSRVDEPLASGDHVLRFATGDWFDAADRDHLHPWIDVAVTVADQPHLHVALLLGPWSYTTYRGS